MPFRSNAQRKFLFAKHPEVAKKFAAKTPKGTKLPEHVNPAESDKQAIMAALKQRQQRKY